MNIITNYDIDEVFKNIKIKKPISFNNRKYLIFIRKTKLFIISISSMYLPYDFIHNKKILIYSIFANSIIIILLIF